MEKNRQPKKYSKEGSSWRYEAINICYSFIDNSSGRKNISLVPTRVKKTKVNDRSSKEETILEGLQIKTDQESLPQVYQIQISIFIVRPLIYPSINPRLLTKAGNNPTGIAIFQHNTTQSATIRFLKWIVLFRNELSFKELCCEKQSLRQGLGLCCE